jgi:hypothetical protein
MNLPSSFGSNFSKLIVYIRPECHHFTVTSTSIFVFVRFYTQSFVKTSQIHFIATVTLKRKYVKQGLHTNVNILPKCVFRLKWR